MSENNENKLDYTCGLSDEELNKRFEESIRIDNKIREGVEKMTTYKSEIEIFMNDIENEILDWKYIVYKDKLPDYTFKLTAQQLKFLNNLEKEKNLKKIIRKYETEANSKFQPNGGILDTTKVKLEQCQEGFYLTINGSFAVVEKFIPWLIESTKVNK